MRLDKDSCNVSSTWYCPHCIQTILPFNHFDEDEDFFGAFNDYFSESKTEDISASFFHLNIKSLPKHYDELNLYLDLLKVKFSFIALTETWLSESTEELHGIQNYNVVN